MVNGSVFSGEMAGASKVYAGKVFIGRKSADQVFAGNAKGKTGGPAPTPMKTAEYFFQQVVNIDCPAAHMIEIEIRSPYPRRPLISVATTSLGSLKAGMP